MYMSTRANLEYWSTDNCCLYWSLRTGAITIGFFSMIWQALMVMSGVMMLVKCPVTPDNTTTNITIITATSDNTTPSIDPLTLDLVVDSSSGDMDDELIEERERSAGCLGGIGGNVSSTNGSNSSSKSTNTTRKVLITCPWLPDPETEVLEVYSEEKLFLVAGIFIAYSGVYCILSLCVIVGAFTRSVSLVQGWVAFTSFHNLLILASLFVPLPFTTLLHLFLSIGYFILSLYIWAVVKSFMHALKVELNKPLLPEGSITDYTVDGVDVTEIPVQV